MFRFSHHPPITACYAEHTKTRVSYTSRIYTKEFNVTEISCNQGFSISLLNLYSIMSFFLKLLFPKHIFALQTLDPSSKNRYRYFLNICFSFLFISFFSICFLFFRFFFRKVICCVISFGQNEEAWKDRNKKSESEFR